MSTDINHFQTEGSSFIVPPAGGGDNGTTGGNLGKDNLRHLHSSDSIQEGQRDGKVKGIGQLDCITESQLQGLPWSWLDLLVLFPRDKSLEKIVSAV